MDRTAWLESRRRGIGGSDAAAIFGLSKYQSAIDVWEAKLGIAPVRPETAAMRWGLRLEDTIAAAYAEERGFRVRKVGGIRRAHHVTTFPMIGSLDRLAYEDPGVRVLELKTRRSADGLGTENDPPERRVPADWYLQIQHYLEVVDLEIADVAVLVGGSDFRVIEIPRDRAFGADLVAEEGAFWNTYVLGKVQPPVGPDDLAFLARKYPRDAGEERVATSEQELLIDAYLAEVEQIERHEGLRDGYRAKIEDAMGTATRLISGGAVVSWKAHDRTSVTWKAYAEVLEQIVEQHAPDEDLPGLRSGYTKTEPVRPFRADRKEGS